MKKIIYSNYPLKYDYYVTEDGKIYSDVSKKYLSVRLDKDGYEKVRLIGIDNKRHQYSVHRLILSNFNPIDNMENLQVNHKDGIKTNNNLSNLEWMTCQENISHAVENKLRNQKGDSNYFHKLNEEEVLEMIKLIQTKQYSNIELGKKFGVHADTVGRIKHKKLWKHLTENINFN